MTTVSETVTIRASAPGAPATLSIPEAVAEALGLKAGATLRAVSTPEGLLLQTATVPTDTEEADFAEAMEIFGEFSEQYKNALRELAK